jgi:hypothetical protein
MAHRTVTLLSSSGKHTCNADIDSHACWLDSIDLREATGFELKPEGLCRDHLCFPIPRGREAEVTRDGAVNVAAFWRLRNAPLAASRDGDIWSLGEPPAERANLLQSLEAPDFTLPDSAGRMHSLSDYRGRKVLLATWASW